MKYSIQFVTYNTFVVEANSEDEAVEIANKNFEYGNVDYLWDEYDIEEVKE